MIFLLEYTIRPSGNARDLPIFAAYVSRNPNSPPVPCNANNINGSPSNGMASSVAKSPPTSSVNINMNSSIRVHSPATATPALRTPKEVAYRPKGTLHHSFSERNSILLKFKLNSTTFFEIL